jgi:branched-chain amino acid transport system substrate-binding protein
MAGCRAISTIAAVGWAALALVPAASGAARAAEDAITLGAALSLTGKNAVNEKGGVTLAGKRYRMALKFRDDESSPEQSALLAERLIAEDGVKFMLGPYSSSFTRVVAPVAERHRVVMIEGNGDDRDLFTQGYRYLFAVLTTSERYLGSAVALLAELATAVGKDPKTLKIAIAVDSDPFSQDVRDGIIETPRSGA